ncbi:MAG: Imidazole glycerol phosphate synthase subunit HisF [Pelotomaculum sp. PtaB.Bin104]|nr:MAG: Imidazole glycerol phosphate synthase subunit HisF [Pelotomaculum sp. PtaB.Bin104]
MVSIDARRTANGVYMCFSHCGSRPTGREVGAWAQEVSLLGAGEILITSIEKDGTMQGYDLELIKLVADNVNIPVIASGGAGNYEHMFEVIFKANVSAVAAASIYHFTQQTPKEAKQFLAQKGISVRNVNAQAVQHAN